jgi:beta-phosphoglucomutase
MSNQHLLIATIFDMDGVLVDTYDAHYRSWLAMAEPEGLSFTRQEFTTTFGRTSREIIDTFWGMGRFSDKEIAELDARKEAAFRQIIAGDIPVMPGVQHLLESLRVEGFKLAVGSSGPPANVDLVLDGLGIRGLFDTVVTGGDVARGKPDPQVFLLAAQRVAIPPERCAVVEDAPPGVSAALAAGMTAIGLCSTGRTRESISQAHLVVDSLNDLTPELIRELILQTRGET